MTTPNPITGIFILLSIAFVPRLQAGGTWVPLANPPPGPAGHFMLLTDGSVMAENLTTNYGPGWFRLVPDNHGSYASGTWANIAPMKDTRLDFGSIVLTNGNVLVFGGEYGSGSATSEIYNPVSNTWTTIAVPTSLLNPALNSTVFATSQGFSDSAAMLLKNGNVLVSPVAANSYGQTMIFNVANNTWQAGPHTSGLQVEASWIKLPDDSILTVDYAETFTERYLPAANTWVADQTPPVDLYDAAGEVGPAMLLPNGKAIFFGATSNTAIYTPSGTSSPGTWVAGPNIPRSQGMSDAPAAMLVNGKVLCTVGHVATNSTEWAPPVTFYEYDYVSNTFASVGAPLPGINSVYTNWNGGAGNSGVGYAYGGGTNFNEVQWPTLMLDLPDGTVLFGHRRSDFYVYQPGGVPLAAGKPAITSITTNADGSLHLTGTMFNGLCQGATYGDDEQMDSNFPIVKFTDIGGTVRFGRTFNWSRTSVQTSNAVVSTDCTIPAGASSQDLIQVIANGIASDVPVNMVTVTNDNGPGSLRQIVASAPAGTTITFANSLSGQTILLANGEIALTQNVTIDGSALASPIRLNGNHNSRIFNIGGVSVTLNSLILTNAFAGGGNWGGAIANGGTLALNNCTVTGNSVDPASNGGGIQNNNQLTLTGCTFYGNSAGFSGAVDNRGTLVAKNCTFYGNSAVAGNGGAIDNPFSATLSLLNCTFVGNSATSLGGAIDNYLSNVNFTNCIIAGNIGDDIYNWAGSTNTAGGSNIVQALDNAGTLFGANTILAANPLLGPLANNGGPTLTLLPQIASPAIDAGSSSAAAGLATDQRGLPRLVGDAVDIGAVEADIVPYVFNNHDSGYGSLRYAANYATNNSTITFSNALSGQVILLTSGVMTLGNNVTIDASALTNRVLINGNHSSQAFSVNGGVTAILNFLTVTNCFTSGFGGGIFSVGNLTLNDCQLVNNQSTGTGGALATAFGNLTLRQTTVSGNTCDNCSAIYIKDQSAGMIGCTISGNSGSNGDAVRLNADLGNATLGVINSTFSGNTIYSGFGPVLTLQSTAPLSASATLTCCTVANNQALSSGQSGAIYLQPGSGTNSVKLFSTVVSGNTISGAPSDITGNIDASSGFNLIGSGGGLVDGVNGNQVGVSEPQLSALGNYGGPTQTMPPLAGSPAVDAGSDLITLVIYTDQRGLSRKSGEHVDVGAAELQLVTANTPTHIANAKKLSNGSLQLNFTNQSGASFRVLTATNVSLPLATWTEIGFAIETPASSGQFQFTDPQSTNYSKRFYRVKSP